ncbi:MAG TPA: hydroxyphenylacetyl-CoA thioesterase PaaI [Steroidobacteraceae bacterium]|nr:hydroxyphenylacetyl-CoA thioesterase PaaI [Steroidobacteraceae bacterium]
MTDAAELARQAAGELYSRDVAARALGIEILAVDTGRATLAMRVRPDMLNGHAICHGGLIFALADTAFAYACNSYNENTLAASAAIEFLAPAREGDLLTATASEQSRGRRLGLYDIEVSNQQGTRIALFRGRSARVGGNVLAGAGDK